MSKTITVTLCGGPCDGMCVPLMTLDGTPHFGFIINAPFTERTSAVPNTEWHELHERTAIYKLQIDNSATFVGVLR